MNLVKPTRDQIIQLAKLQFFNIDNEQLNILQEEFDTIIDQFNMLATIDVEGLEPLSFLSAINSSLLREDEITQHTFNIKDIAKNTTNIIDNYVAIKAK